MADANVMKILVSTDNHLGYAEKDVVIGEDSFNNFERVLQTAQDLDVDFVLLGGDLFHESEPSKNTFVKADRLLSKHCLYEKQSKIKILSDQKNNFAEGRVNFENPNLKVGLPVFSIHGNHDYPHGETSTSAMDVPSSSGLINYFGKKEIDEDGNLSLAPILIQKGETKLALYGLGHIADQRVGTVFRRHGAVKWISAAEADGGDDDDWFNMFVIHQNRVQRGFSNTNGWIEDRHLADFENLDFVVWGHEHQCIPENQPSGAGDFSVLQPGSTVATSLAEGESDPKHVFLLEVQKMREGGVRHRVIKHRLPGVRPFKFENVVLVEQHGVHASRENSIKEFVRWKLEAMISDCQKHNPDILPLIRLRIDYTGFDLIRTQEIQKRFTGMVANPEDMLLWVKKSRRKQKAAANGPATTFTADVQEHGLMDELLMSELDGNLRLLSVESCTTAFQAVVLSNSNTGMRKVFERNLNKIRERVLTMDAEDEETVRDHAKQIAQEIGGELTSTLQNADFFDAVDTTRGPVRSREEGSIDLNDSDDETTSVRQEPTTQQRSRMSEVLSGRRGSYLRQTKRRR